MAKRRANGERNIRKRSDGRWEGRYTAGRDPQTGKPIYKNVLGKTQGETKEKLKRAIQETKGLDIVKSDQYTIGQWIPDRRANLPRQCPKHAAPGTEAGWFARGEIPRFETPVCQAHDKKY